MAPYLNGERDREDAAAPRKVYIRHQWIGCTTFAFIELMAGIWFAAGIIKWTFF